MVSYYCIYGFSKKHLHAWLAQWETVSVVSWWPQYCPMRSLCLRQHWGSRGNKTHCFPWGQSWSVLSYLPAKKNGANRKKIMSCCYYRELVSFVHPKELARFDPRHLTQCPHIKKSTQVKTYNSVVWKRERNLMFFSFTSVTIWLNTYKVHS